MTILPALDHHESGVRWGRSDGSHADHGGHETIADLLRCERRRTLTGRVTRWAASLCFREDPTLRRHCTCTVKWAPHGARTKYIMVMGTTDRRAAESRALAATR